MSKYKKLINKLPGLRGFWPMNVNYSFCHCDNPWIVKMLDMSGSKPVIHNICLRCKLPVKNIVSRMPKLIVTR